MMVAVVDYGMGNLRSLAKALEAVGAEVCVSSDPATLGRAERIVLPGVGAFGECVSNLRRSGLIDALEMEVRVHKKPFLGICLGMQVLATEGREYGIHPGLDWIPGVVRSFREDRQVKVPHVGWNEVIPRRPSPLFAGLRAESTFYFVHSYHFVCKDPGSVAAECGEHFCDPVPPRKESGSGAAPAAQFLTLGASLKPADACSRLGSFPRSC
jgi:glutamine amidotransferase